MLPSSPVDALGGEARLDPGLVRGLLGALLGDHHHHAVAASRADDNRQRQRAEAFEMPVERAGQVQRGLQAGFLPGIVVNQQQNVLHELPPSAVRCGGAGADGRDAAADALAG